MIISQRYGIMQLNTCFNEVFVFQLLIIDYYSVSIPTDSDVCVIKKHAVLTSPKNVCMRFHQAFMLRLCDYVTVRRKKNGVYTIPISMVGGVQVVNMVTTARGMIWQRLGKSDKCVCF